MTEAFICDAVRTPIGRYGGSLSSVRADDLAAIPIRALIDRNPDVDWGELDDVILGCANQAGEDNRNLARMAGLRRPTAARLIAEFGALAGVSIEDEIARFESIADHEVRSALDWWRLPPDFRAARTALRGSCAASRCSASGPRGASTSAEPLPARGPRTLAARADTAEAWR